MPNLPDATHDQVDSPEWAIAAWNQNIRQGNASLTQDSQLPIPDAQKVDYLLQLLTL